MLFFRKDGDNPDRIEHCAPGDIKASLPIARRWLDHMRREGLCAEVPDDDLLAELIKHAEFDVYEWQKLASPVWMNINQGNVLNKNARQKGSMTSDTFARCSLILLPIIHSSAIVPAISFSQSIEITVSQMTFLSNVIGK